VLKQPRRSPRLSLRVLLSASWKADEDTIVRDAIAVSINANGALIKLLTEYCPADRIMIENVATHQSREARIVSMAEAPGESAAYLVTFEFVQPASRFWERVYFYTSEGLEIMHIDPRLLADPVSDACVRLALDAERQAAQRFRGD
jgi:hypothetical protein